MSVKTCSKALNDGSMQVLIDSFFLDVFAAHVMQFPLKVFSAFLRLTTHICEFFNILVMFLAEGWSDRSWRVFTM